MKMTNHILTKGLSVIVGLGVTGLACVRYLAAQGVNLAVNDSRAEPPGLNDLKQQFPQVPYICGHFDRDLLNKAQQLIISPGVSLQQPEIAEQIARGVEVIGDIELFARLTKVPVVAITGSNGK